METNGAVQRWDRLMRYLADYHSWVCVGAHHCPQAGGVMFAATHSLASYELFIVAHGTELVFGRKTYIVGDNLMFKIPGLGPALKEIGFIGGTREELVDRLRAGDMIGIAPGGMKEALRSTRDRYTFDWSRRLGFADVAMRAGVPVLPHVCPQADHIFTVYGNPVTDLLFKQFKVPVPLFRGRGPTPIPRPVKLVSVVGKPIYPDVAPDQVKDEDVKAFHGKIVAAIGTLMAEATRIGDHPEGDDVRAYPS